MKAKILPMMIGAVLAGGMAAAQADVKIMGHLDESIVSWDDEQGLWFGNGTDDDDVNLRCTTCSIGFQGSEDLGNGLSAIFKLDFQFDINNRNKSDGSDSGSITDRDQWVGVKTGNFGQVRVGTISTGYKSHGASIDPLYRTVLQGRDVGLQSSLQKGAGEEGQGRAENTIRYDSPNWNGLKAVAHYTLDGTEDDGEDNDPYGIGASYQNGGILVFADYIANNGEGGLVDSPPAVIGDAQDDLSAWKVGGKYSLNNFAVMAQYEDITEDNNAPGESDEETTVWHVAGSYTMGNNMIYLGYGMGEEDKSKDEYTAWTIAGMHSLSKRTKLYAGYASNEPDLDASPDPDESSMFAVGVKHKF